MSSSVFRLSSHKFHLTYKTHLNYNDWLAWAEDNFKKIKEYSIVHETGDEHHGYPHTHIYVYFEEKVVSKKQNIFNFKLDEFNDYWTDSFWENYIKEDEKKSGIHPHIKTVKDDNHRDEIVNNYHKKQNIPFTNILSGEELVLKEQEEKKANCKKCNKEKYAKKHTCGLIEYVEEKPKPKKIGLNELQEKFKEDPDFDAISYYAGDDISKITAIQRALPYVKKPIGDEPKVLWRPWQMKVLETLSKECTNDRTILWYSDILGRSGKSKFTEHLEMFYKIMFLQDLKLSTVACRIRAAYEKGGNEINTIIIDLPRGYKMEKEHYNTLEYLKSGKITSEKYDSVKINFTGSYNKPPHVIVFSNELPDFNKLTGDKLGLLVIDKLGVDIKYENILDVPEIILPEGYQKPGTIKIVAQPDEIIEDESSYKSFNFKFTDEEKEFSRNFWTDQANKEDQVKKQEKLTQRNLIADIINQELYK
jgi:hypothetical protein